MNILIKPVITEKSMLAASRGVYTFVVARNANKNQVKETVESLFAVQVVSVNTSVVKLAIKRTGRLRIRQLAKSEKQARVTLKSGQTIALFDLKEDK